MDTLVPRREFVTEAEVERLVRSAEYRALREDGC
jgi:hypothetical protein